MNYRNWKTAITAFFNGTDDFIIGVVAGTVCDYLAYYINDIFRKNAYDLNAVRILTADINLSHCWGMDRSI